MTFIIPVSDQLWDSFGKINVQIIGIVVLWIFFVCYGDIRVFLDHNRSSKSELILCKEVCMSENRLRGF